MLFAFWFIVLSTQSWTLSGFALGRVVLQKRCRNIGWRPETHSPQFVVVFVTITHEKLFSYLDVTFGNICDHWQTIWHVPHCIKIDEVLLVVVDISGKVWIAWIWSINQQTVVASVPKVPVPVVLLWRQGSSTHKNPFIVTNYSVSRNKHSRKNTTAGSVDCGILQFKLTWSDVWPIFIGLKKFIFLVFILIQHLQLANLAAWSTSRHLSETCVACKSNKFNWSMLFPKFWSTRKRARAWPQESLSVLSHNAICGVRSCVNWKFEPLFKVITSQGVQIRIDFPIGIRLYQIFQHDFLNGTTQDWKNNFLNIWSKTESAQKKVVSHAISDFIAQPYKFPSTDET